MIISHNSFVESEVFICCKKTGAPLFGIIRDIYDHRMLLGCTGRSLLVATYNKYGMR